MYNWLYIRDPRLEYVEAARDSFEQATRILGVPTTKHLFCSTVTFLVFENTLVVIRRIHQEIHCFTNIQICV